MALGRNISPGQGETYYQKDDYYLTREGGEDHKLEWGGKLAAELGLKGKVDPEVWKDALHGHFPGGIEIKGGSFKDPATGEPQRRAGTDFEFSAPKSVSIQALVFDDERLIEAHRQAVAEAMAFLEEKIGARRGHGGKDWETTGRGLAGRVTHLTSREGDPHLHDHLVFLNLTRNADGSWQAMTNDRMFQYQRTAQEIYHAALSQMLEKLGYTVETGKYGEPQIEGFTREMLEYFSGRAAQIEAYIRDKWGIEWSKLSREERNEKRHLKDEAWDRTRKGKTVSEVEGRQAKWQAEARAAGIQPVEPGKAAPKLTPAKRFEVAREALSFAVAHHTERESAVKESELIRTALQEGRGSITYDDLKKAYDEAIKKGELIRQADHLAGSTASLVTSREALKREKEILTFEKEGRGAVKPVMNPIKADATLHDLQNRGGIKLNGEQMAAARMILTTDNRYAGINGYAGVGKTTMLKPAVEALKENGYDVVGLGPQHSAVQALKEAGISEARTLQSWLADRKAGEALTPRSVVVIDEAGLANAKDLESAMRRIERAGARAVLMGDIKQYESVAAGPAFALLQKKGMETVYVTEMQRQAKASEEIREAARASVDDPARAVKLLEQHTVEIKDDAERYRAIAREAIKSDLKETLILAGTHRAKDAINREVREGLGLEGKGEDFHRFEAKDLTAAERKKIDSYEAGDMIKFSKSYRSLNAKAGDVGVIKSVDRESGRVVATVNGKDVSFLPRKLKGDGHEIGEVKKIELAKGDRIRITGNDLKKEGITNGMRGEVLEAARDRVKIRLDSGKEVVMRQEKKPLELDHGYAQTGHSAQGLGAKKVLMDVDARSKTTSQRAFYTNLTRVKNFIKLFTNDRASFGAAVSRQSQKTMAHEVQEASKQMTKMQQQAAAMGK